MSFFLVDSSFEQEGLQLNMVDEAMALDWLNTKSWVSCIEDEATKQHLRCICPDKKARLDQVDLPTLGPDDEVLLVERAGDEASRGPRLPGKAPERLILWRFRLKPK
jgi:hypothetical protein